MGDMDSATRETREWFAERGTIVEMIEDQESNDMDKCLLHLARVFPEAHARPRTVVLGAFGGRIDHEMQNLNALFTWYVLFHCISGVGFPVLCGLDSWSSLLRLPPPHRSGLLPSLLLLSRDSTAIALRPGRSEISLEPWETSVCGLIPLGA